MLGASFRWRGKLDILHSSIVYRNFASNLEGRTFITSSSAEEEVETKFRVTPAILERIQQLHLTPVTKTFTDTYYDYVHTTHSSSSNGSIANSAVQYPLTTHDMWMRKRGEIFELKSPSTREGTNYNHNTRIDHYRESKSWPEIASILQTVLQYDSMPRILPGEEESSYKASSVSKDAHTLMMTPTRWLTLCGLSPFATITTTRNRYTLHVNPSFATGIGEKSTAVAGTATSSYSHSNSHTVYVDIDKVVFHPTTETFQKQVVVHTPDSQEDMNDLSSLTYMIGEVEVAQAAIPPPMQSVVVTPAAAAEVAIADTLAALGIITKSTIHDHGIKEEGVRGKVLEFLIRFRPHHYSALERCGLIAAKLK